MYYKDKKIKECPICKKEFETIDVRRKYCGYRCANKGRKSKQDRLRKKYEKQNKLKYGIKNEESGKKMMKCKTCGNSYSRYVSQIKYRGSSYCSVECRYEDQKRKKVSIKRIDDAWSKAVKLYAGNKCEYCGKENYLNSHHIFSRSNLSTRWHIPNGISLCAGHHTLQSDFSAHKTPMEFSEWVKEKRGETWYEELRKKAKEVVKLSKKDRYDIYYNLIEVIDHFNEGLK